MVIHALDVDVDAVGIWCGIVCGLDMHTVTASL